MNRIILSLAIMAIGCVQQVFAQQDAMFTHYMFNQVVYNPAFVGAEMGDNFCINLVHHNQWMGYSDEYGSAAPSPLPLISINRLSLANTNWGLA